MAKSPAQVYALYLADEWLKTEPVTTKLDYQGRVYVSTMLRSEMGLPMDEADELSLWAQEQKNGTTLNPR